MSSLYVFPAASVGGVQPLLFDFLSVLGNSTITGATFSVALFAGTDSSPDSVLSGSPIIDGTSVIQNFLGNIPGNIYFITCLVTTSLDEILDISGYVSVLNNPYVF